MSHIIQFPVVRFSIAGAASLMTCFLLFFLMQDLISNTGETEAPPAAPAINLYKVILPPRLPIQPTVKPPRRLPVDPPPLPRIDPVDTGGGVTPVGIDNVTPGDLFTINGPATRTPADGDFLPVVKVQPVYPRSAEAQGLEGYTIVEFTVTTSGTTRDIRVIESSSTVFNQVSVNAAARFKYLPRVIDGEEVEVRGVRNRFNFNLE